MNTSPIISAVPTMWNGIRFRSRLEARWAIVFDTMELKYQYEPEAYALPPFVPTEDEPGYDADRKVGYPATNYLPDFWLPQADAFVEIKGAEPPRSVTLDLYRLGKLTDKQTILAVGDVFNEVQPESIYQIYPYWDNFFWLCDCEMCRKIGWQFEGRAARLCKCHPDDKNYRWNGFFGALEVARTHRFWK